MGSGNDGQRRQWAVAMVMMAAMACLHNSTVQQKLQPFLPATTTGKELHVN